MREPIRSWVFGIMLAIFLALPIGIVAWSAYMGHIKSMREQIQRTLDGLAATLAEDIEQGQSERLVDAKTIAAQHDLATASEHELNRVAEMLVRNYEAYDQVIFAEAVDGRICAGCFRDQDGRILPYKASPSAHVAGQPWFITALESPTTTSVTTIPLGPDPLLAGLLPNETLVVRHLVILRDASGYPQRICVISVSAERTIHRLLERTIHRLRLHDLPGCTISINGDYGSAIDHDGQDTRLRLTPSSADYPDATSKDLIHGRASRLNHRVQISVDASQAVPWRTDFFHRYSAHFVGCGILVCVGMSILAMCYRRSKIRNHELISRQRELAAATAKAKSDMLAIMSHEVRTPLHGMLGVSDILAETKLDDQQAELVTTMQQAGRHLRELINNALDHERLLAGKMPFKSEPTEWRNVIHQVNRLLQPMAAQAGVTLHCTTDASVPSWIRTDRHRLRQVLNNLMSNALRFTPQGGSVHVNTQLISDGRYLRCTVTDTGPGIAQDRQSAIFEPFVQEDDNVAGRYGGTGLGLTICKMIIMKMNGRIGLQSRIGHGTTFWFEVPVELAQAPIDRHGSTTTLTGAQPLPLSILVAEDDDICAFTLTHMLSKIGCTSLRVADGAAAVQAAAACRYDAVILDLHMPLLDGLGAARAIRAAEPPGKQIPIIAMSGSDVDEAAFLAAGITAVVPKPVSLAELRSALRRLCFT